MKPCNITSRSFITARLSESNKTTGYSPDLKCAISHICVHYFIVLSCCLHFSINHKKIKGKECIHVIIIIIEFFLCSVNNTSTLKDFSQCENLRELFIRKNQIEDLSEICHLKTLPNLRNLWLADNPCDQTENYRNTVLKTLPNLQKLDNIGK